MSKDDWLELYLIDAINAKLCTTIHCPTCGAQDFRKGLLQEHSRIFNKATPATMVEAAEDIARCLRSVSCPKPDLEEAMESAIRLILFDIWDALGRLNAEEKIQTILLRSWSGEILARMQAHYKQRREARRTYLESQDPKLVQQRRDAKRRQKQQQHTERIERKKERDRLWRETHPDDHGI